MTQQIILVVGPDMTGKTQIARALAKKLEIPYFKASSEHDTYLSNKNKFIQQLRFSDPRLIDFLQQTGYSVVMDRGYPCEKVYSQVLGRQTDAKALAFIDDQMASLNARIIICHRSSYEGIIDDIDPTINESVLIRLDEEYQQFIHWTRCSTLLLNVDDNNIKREISDIMKWLGQKDD